MSVLAIGNRLAATTTRQAIVTARPTTLSPVSVHHRWLTLSGPTMANTDLRDIGRDPKVQPNPKPDVDQHPKLSSEPKWTTPGRPEPQPKMWRWIPNVTEESHHRKEAKSTLPENDNDPDKYKRETHPDEAPDAQEINDRSTKSPSTADKQSDFEKIRSKIDYANYPAPKRLSSLKEAVHADLKAAKNKFEEVKENVKHLPDKAKELEHQIESKGSKLADKIKSFVKRDNEQKKSD